MRELGPDAAAGRLTFYASPPHTCSYLPGRRAVSVFADPDAAMDVALYSRLSDYGFRRSGRHVYAPRCPQCNACRPARIPVDAFVPDRSQRRVARRNADLEVTRHAAGFVPEHFALYRAYMSARHPGGGMDDPDPGKYLDFIASPWSDSALYAFRLRGRLAAVAVVDHLLQGLSAVYTFFDPRLAQRSLGTFAVLWQVGEARRLGLPWVYLGYWIRDCRKMAYKARFRPLELRRDGVWVRHEGRGDIPA